MLDINLLPAAGALSGAEILAMARGANEYQVPFSQILLCPFNSPTGSYTPVLLDLQKLIDMNSASALVLTLPKSFPKGWSCGWRQGGAGVITFTPEAGASLIGFQSPSASQGLYAIGSLIVTANADGNSAVWQLSGNAV